MTLAPQLKDVTDAVNQIPTLANAIADLSVTPVGIVGLIVVLLWILVNKDFSHILGMLERKEKRRLEYLDAYVGKPELGDLEAVEVLKDLRDAHYFKLATGIYAEKKSRSALVKLYSRTSHRISWREIGKAFTYIEFDTFENSTIRIPTAIDNIGYWYNQFVGFVCLLAASGFLLFIQFSSSKTIGTLALGFIGVFFLVFVAVFSFIQNEPLHSAKRIQKEIQNLQTVANATDTPVS